MASQMLSVVSNLPGKVRLGTVGELVPETEIMAVDDAGQAVGIRARRGLHQRAAGDAGVLAASRGNP